jgi:hypothetical protein
MNQRGQTDPKNIDVREHACLLFMSDRIFMVVADLHGGPELLTRLFPGPRDLRPVLARLLKAGLVEIHNSEISCHQDAYAITDAGRAALQS